ncbi:MAG: prolyl oligopeptidase family serine peptidase [Phycisphaerales bacterium]
MLFTAALFLLVSSTNVSGLLSIAPPPPSEKHAVVEVLHGEELSDDFRWLEALESESEAVKEWTTAQNNYTRSILDNLPQRDRIEERIGELMTIGSVGAPTMRGNRYFYRERKGSENQSILYLREGFDGEPRVLIDPNTLDERGLYSLDWTAPTHDGSLLAFGLSYAGDEMSVLYVMNVDTGVWLADEIRGKVFITGWLADKSGFTYGKLDDPANAYSRSYYFHELGTNARQDRHIITQEEPSRIPGASLTEDGRWLIVTVSDGWVRNDLYIADADRWMRDGTKELIPVAVGLDGRFGVAFVRADVMYVTTTFESPNGRLMKIDMNDPEQDQWKTVIAERDTDVLQGAREARDRFVVSYEQDATSQFEAFSYDGKSLGHIALPGSGLGSASIATEDDRTEAFLTYTSYNEPTSIYRLDLKQPDELTLWARPEVPVDPESVIVKQVFFASADGTQVPMFIVHKKGLELDGGNPCVLYGYGGFNVSMTPGFSATRFPWYEDGGVYAVANLRGGSEYGEAWHKAGMLANKQNVFDDLYAAAQYLIDNGYTSSEHLGVQGGSNGGLLTGVAVTQRPDLFACAISAVPLLDMLRYDQFLMAKFWVPEYGSPANPEHHRWLRAYSPYHNIEAGQKYPAVFFTAGENDNRVHPLHARKMAAKMQTVAGNDMNEDPILLWVDRESGHGSGKPLHLRIRDVADQHMFLAWQTGMLDKYMGDN